MFDILGTKLTCKKFYCILQSKFIFENVLEEVLQDITFLLLIQELTIDF